MSAALTTLLGAVGAVGAILAVLVPLLLTLGRRMDRFEARFEALARDVADVRRDLHAEATVIRADLHALAERVARMEGTMSGPWRPPANGNPAPATAAATEATC